MAFELVKEKVLLPQEDALKNFVEKLIEKGVSEDTIISCFEPTFNKQSSPQKKQQLTIIKNYTTKNHALCGPIELYPALKNELLSKHGSGFKSNSKLTCGSGYLFTPNKLDTLKAFLNKKNIKFNIEEKSKKNKKVEKIEKEQESEEVNVDELRDVTEDTVEEHEQEPIPSEEEENVEIIDQ